MEMKKLPIGIDSFEKIRKNDFYYADKSMFIAELLRNWGEVNLFTRPRRFGKSLNMSMLKSFFEIGCDKTLFEGLEIAKEKELCEQCMGKFPVISITLKGVDGRTFEAARDAVCFVIGTEARRFSFLTNSDRLTEEEKESYRSFVKVNDNGDYSMSNTVMENSLLTLSSLLSRHYGCKVVILIDEYDVPLDKAFQARFYDEMLSLIRSLLGNALKSNASLQFAVLTGCLRISKESIFTGLNNLKVHTITDTRYDEYFGFTDNDVKNLLEYYDLGKHYDMVKEWYDGYQFGNVSVYCPWDVINYCDEARSTPGMIPRNYWANTSGNAMVRRFLNHASQQTKDEIEQLIEGNSIFKPVNQELTYSELDKSIENLWSVLFTTGYLTQRRQVDEMQYELVIPNREIRNLFITQVKEWFQENAVSNTQQIEKFCAAFPEGNAALLEEMLNDYLWDSISIRDTAVRKERKEHFYHGMLLGLLSYKRDWKMKSNAESGEGYSDILIETPNRIGVVIELKYAHDRNLEACCKEAVRQIGEKKYDTALADDGMKVIMKYGIAFYKKSCKVIKA